MRAKRSKAYKKLMSQYALTFGFREPYQILLDSAFVLTATQCKMEIDRFLEITLHAKTKPMITQCSMRHLYKRRAEPGVSAAIEAAKGCERRRCGHHPDDYPEPLDELECLKSVVDPKDNGVNKHKYCCALNDEEARGALRMVPGTPLLYIKRSVLILEPISNVSAKARSRDEKSKFRAELKAPAGKRKREEDDSDDDDADRDAPSSNTEKKKKKRKGPSGPNPLAVKKKKTKTDSKANHEGSTTTGGDADGNGASGEAPKKKRKRKHKSKGVADGADEVHEVTGEAAAEAED
ncbi:Fcf1-domain-containing protein [Xylariaceae sp. FL0016]|nr:Fcf1-domain-containing protein [Xylariaceae sp. FL0016]